jgi:6,7-dimethyl-8-ribityllumazine synthase
VTVFEGERAGRGRRIAIVAARFNGAVTSRLVDGALAGLAASGVAGDDVDVAWVPGAFEIPLVARRMAASGAYDAVICLGAVIRGETAHFDLVAREAARGIREASRDTGVPVIFEVLAVEDLAQAEDRAGGKHGNKGRDAALAALEMASLLETIPKEEP